MKMDINQAVRAVLNKGLIIYPTETLFALGGLGNSSGVVDRVRKIKGRPGYKPLPLVAGSVDQCLDAVQLDGQSLEIGRMFWPGPLSILARARDGIPTGVKDEQGLVSIRVTPHPDASRLCLMSGFPLIATSANFSGSPACSDINFLDKDLAALVDGVFFSSHRPAGGHPSTLIRVVGPDRIKVIRPGKISIADLEKKGLKVDSS
ncbi:L-threonylcarbamoyladenylate synthase [Desulfonatronovibrio hydrogenovorans]|uniref:L-threonylcarbamoyladenylate synthase n=1 Tax=Desulfonatronovibrio hydrogenovorans TaxID=53245 RepID=UPI000491D491|nr:L-threonylcarbamoyladenylate synthase [Desulfonatronovibrio hydrogenovorans]